jgi:hypothetical protein
MALVQQENQTHSLANQALFEIAFLAYGALQLRGHWIGTKVRMTRNADRVPAQTFDVVVPALGLYVDQGASHEVLAVDKFRCHNSASALMDARRWLFDTQMIAASRVRSLS